LAPAALALTSLAAFAKDHALMINASPSLPYWAIWLDRGALPQRGEIILFDPPASPLLERHFGKEPKPFGKR
jgi:conjugal transfer pilin signal peptidase TrbI